MKNYKIILILFLIFFSYNKIIKPSILNNKIDILKFCLSTSICLYGVYDVMGDVLANEENYKKWDERYIRFLKFRNKNEADKGKLNEVLLFGYAAIVPTRLFQFACIAGGGSYAYSKFNNLMK